MKGSITRRGCLAVFGLLVATQGGCCCWEALTARSQSPDEVEPDYVGTRLIGDMVVPFGMFPVKVDEVGLVTGLAGTGGDPSPSPQRASLVAEMQTRGVDKPNSVLASPDTALVMVRGVLRPGIQKGDRFDIEVRIPSRSDTTSLRGGHLLETRMRQMAVLDNQVREGNVWGLAAGPVMVDPAADAEHDSVLLGRGRILGGGVAIRSRQLGLVLRPDYQNVLNSARVANAVNKRFHTFQKGVKIGVATAKTDEFIELVVHPRYKENVARYMLLVQSIALQESANEQVARIAELKQRLLDPVTSSKAALQLEAIGPDATKAPLAGVDSAEPEVRFYSAEALAYLDCREAAEPLGQIARDEPAFRVYALSALGAMDDYAAYEQLRELLNATSAETRYGAFRALWAMNPADALVVGEQLGGQFSYHVLGTNGPGMIHVTRNRRPEIVLFGQQQRLQTPLAVNAGSRIMITSHGGDEITVSRFAVDQPDQKRVVSDDVDQVIRAVVELGGTYPDVVQALQEAKSAGALPSRFEIDALPEAGRTYDRLTAGQLPEDPTEDLDRWADVSQTTLPPGNAHDSSEQAAGAESPLDARVEPSDAATAEGSDSRKNPLSLPGFFARITGRDAD